MVGGRWALYAQVGPFDVLVVAQLGTALEGDPAGLEGIAVVGDLKCVLDSRLRRNDGERVWASSYPYTPHCNSEGQETGDD